VVGGLTLQLVAAVVPEVAVGRRLRLVFLVSHPHLFLSVLAGQAQQQIILQVQQVGRLGLTNLQVLLLQVQATVPSPMAVAAVVRRELLERQDQ
jgi:hypothetical protein